MLAKLLKAVLEWLTGLVKSEIKQDVKATDANTPDEIVDEIVRWIKDHQDSLRPILC